MTTSRRSTEASRRLAETSLLFALTLVLSLLESLLPPPPVPLPVRWGLANLPLMYALIQRKLGLAYALAILKGGFALLVRGPIAAVLSLVGGVIALSLAALIFYAGRGRRSLLFISIMAAVGHQFGQVLAISKLYRGLTWSSLSRFFLPFLFLAYITGTITAYLLYEILKRLSLSQH